MIDFSTLPMVEKNETKKQRKAFGLTSPSMIHVLLSCGNTTGPSLARR